MHKILLFLKAILISLFVIWIVFTVSSKIIKINFTAEKDAPTEIKKEEVALPIINNNTKIMFVGDIMLTRGVGTSVKNNFGGDFNKLFDNVSELKNSDILFGNLEGPVSDIGNNVGSKYSFRMDPQILPALKNAGFSIVSFANNHIGDWNINAFRNTLTRLENIGINKTGAGMNKIEVETPTIIEKNGVKFGFLGLSDVGPTWMEAKENNPGILLANDPNLPKIIQNAKLQSDVLIISIHWGDEYKTIHNAHQENLAHIIVDNGADIIIGHHPHVIEDIEEYNGKPIVYSLGNFIFDQYFSKDTMRGMLYIATFDGDNLVDTEQKIITLNKKYQPEGIFTKEQIKEKDDLASNSCPKQTKDYDDMSLLNIGQTTKLPEVTYIPKDLRELSTAFSTKEVCLTKEARDAYEQMATAAKEDKILIKVSSGFRSYNYQKILFDNAIKLNEANGLISVAKPGYSEHQLGTAMDITGSSINYSSANGSFDKTPEDTWLKENAYIYGFVQSYQKDKATITGYKYEPWHYRYVGIENAKEIKERGITITEFLL